MVQLSEKGHGHVSSRSRWLVWFWHTGMHRTAFGHQPWFEIGSVLGEICSPNSILNLRHASSLLSLIHPCCLLGLI